MREENFNYTIVYIPDEKVYGQLLSFGTYASTVHFIKNGIEYEIILLNEDFDVIEEVHIQEIEEEF